MELSPSAPDPSQAFGPLDPSVWDEKRVLFGIVPFDLFGIVLGSYPLFWRHGSVLVLGSFWSVSKSRRSS